MPRPHKGDGGAAQIVETRLYFRNDMGWQLICTFVPGTANSSAQGQLIEASEAAGAGAEYSAMSPPDSLRAAVLALHAKELESAGYDHPSGTSFSDWVKGLSSDESLLLDDKIVVHRSPPEWASLAKILDQSPVAGIFAYQLISGSSAVDATMWVLAYGGCRIFVRLVAGSDALLGDLFDQVRRKALPDYSPERKKTHFVAVNTTVGVSAPATPDARPPRRRNQGMIV